MPQVTASNIIVSTAQIGDKVIVAADIADDTITALQIAANAVGDSEVAAHTTSKITVPSTLLAVAGQVQGDVIYFDGTNWVRLAPGTINKALLTQGAAANPIWGSPAGVPPWVDEGSLEWSAETADKVLTFVNAGRNLYMVVVNLRGTATGNVTLQVNELTAANYKYTYISNGTVGQTVGDTSFRLGTDADLGCVAIAWISPQAGSKGVLVSFNGFGSIASANVNGEYAAAIGSLVSIKILVAGKTMTGKVHVYSLML